jgi:ankyrin repeat protein
MARVLFKKLAAQLSNVGRAVNKLAPFELLCRLMPLDTVKRVLANGSDLSSMREDDGATVFHFLCKSPSGDCQSLVEKALEILVLLAEYAPELMNVRDKWGSTALHLALEGGDFKSARYLLDKNITGEHVDEQRQTGLWWVVGAGQQGIVHEILSRPLDEGYMKKNAWRRLARSH